MKKTMKNFLIGSATTATSIAVAATIDAGLKATINNSSLKDELLKGVAKNKVAAPIAIAAVGIFAAVVGSNPEKTSEESEESPESNEDFDDDFFDEEESSKSVDEEVNENEK